MSRIPWIAALLLVLLASGAAHAEEPVTVFGAASVTDALEEIGRAWAAETGNDVRFSFASSSTLARQIEAGAPADIYVSANVAWMDYLEEKGLIDAASRVVAVSNALVLIAPSDGNAGPVEIDDGVDLPALLGEDERLAVGDPDHVPAGIYARQALESLGQWPALEDRLARTDDVRAALALVERGEAPYGIVYATDTRVSDGVAVVGRFPAASHAPIEYPMALVAGRGTAAARGFLDFMTDERGIAIFAAYGFQTN